jgi:mono/diheme cytochrome c family protein
VIVAASTQRTIGWVIAVVALLAWVVYIFVNIRQSRRERGAEIELAANRDTPPSDEVFEGRRLEQVQLLSVLFLLAIVIGLPVYWLREPGRQSGAETGFGDRSVSRGETLYTEGFQCVNCHGADLSGGSATTIIALPLEDGGTFNVQVGWEAPSLNDVFTRFDTEIENPSESTEVRQILVYGRGVMPAWGLEGGGRGNEQQIQDLIDYLWAEQLGPTESFDKKQDEIAAALEDPDNADRSEGEVLFNVNCARCHTPLWPARGEQVQPNGTVVTVEPGPPGAGRYGPALNRVGLLRTFPDIEDHVAFVQRGADDNVPYGVGPKLGNYGMPGFEQVLDEAQIRAIVEYERSLEQDQDPDFGQEPPVAAAEEESAGEVDEEAGEESAGGGEQESGATGGGEQQSDAEEES